MFGAIVFPQPIIPLTAPFKYGMCPRPANYQTFLIPFWNDLMLFRVVDAEHRDCQALYQTPHMWGTR